MSERKYLNEERYEKTKSKITIVAVIVLIVGLLLGGFLIYKGVKQSNSVDKVALKAQKNEEFFAHGFSAKYYEIDGKLSKAEMAPALYMFGGFVIIASLMISVSIFMFAKRREMLAFSLQQVMPVAKEGAEEIAPTVGKVGKQVASEMAPAYGKIAKEISKGIKEGLKEDK